MQVTGRSGSPWVGRWVQLCSPVGPLTPGSDPSPRTPAALRSRAESVEGDRFLTKGLSLFRQVRSTVTPPLSPSTSSSHLPPFLGHLGTETTVSRSRGPPGSSEVPTENTGCFLWLCGHRWHEPLEVDVGEGWGVGRIKKQDQGTEMVPRAFSNCSATARNHGKKTEHPGSWGLNKQPISQRRNHN